MKLKKMAFVSLFVLGALSFNAEATELKVDSAHSDVQFEVKHLMVAKVRGNFLHFSGNINYNEKDVSQSNVNFEVKTDSITTANPKRDEHLKSAEFFDVKKFPDAKFTSSNIKKISDTKFQVEGDLTIHGITKKVNFDVEYLGKTKDPWGTEKVVFQASAELDRKDFGLTWNKSLDNGGVLIGDKVKLAVDLEAEPSSSSKS